MRLFSIYLTFWGQKEHYSQNSMGSFIPYNALLGVKKDDMGPEAKIVGRATVNAYK